MIPLTFLSRFNNLIISAIQELSRKVTSLENTVLSLQNQLTDVLSRLSALENT